jgi:two-component system LytT family response regulator
MEHRNSLTIATLGRIDVIALDKLVRIEATSNYSRLFMSDGSSLLVAKVLKQFEAQLDKYAFIRTHKTHLVNMQYIRSCTGLQHKMVQLENGEEIAVSRAKQPVVLKRLLAQQAV